MGVIDRKNVQEPSAEKQDQVSNSDDELSIPEVSDADTASVPEEYLLVVPLQRQPKKHKTVLQLCIPSKLRKHCGRRRLRYYKAAEVLLNKEDQSINENHDTRCVFAAEDLHNMWHDSDDVFELTIHDFLNIRPSPFAILLQDTGLLKAWWEFINISNNEKTNETNLKENTLVASNVFRPLGVPKPPEYKRIEKQLKELLLKKSMDVNMVADVEQQLAVFFLHTPKEILKLKKLTRYEVMVKTAICQYHGLDSDIEDTRKKKKDLLVSLLGSEYTQPETALHEYLTQRKMYLSATV